MKVSVRQAREGDGEQIADRCTEAYCGPGLGERTAPYVLADVREAVQAGRLLVALEAKRWWEWSIDPAAGFPR